MIAYHGNQAEKDAILAQLGAHYKADEIIKGRYWEGGKGCAVGCTIHGEDHAVYETRFGIPRALAHLEDRIFEGMDGPHSKEWPIRFMSAIRPGADLSRVVWQFLHWLLTDERVNPGINHPSVAQQVAAVAELMARKSRGEEVSSAWAASAARAAWAAWAARAAWAASAASAASAAWAARAASYKMMADKLVELLEAAP